MKQRSFSLSTKVFAVAWWLVVAAVFANENLHAGADALVVSDQKQLFIDDLFLKQAKQVRLRMHPAHKTGDVLIVCSTSL